MNTIHKGNLTLRPMEARVFHDTEVFGQMDPFVSLEFNGQTLCTEVCKRGGVNPIWNQECLFTYSESNLLFIRLYDHETMKKKHDLIGSVEIDISQYLNTDCSCIEWVDVFYDHQLAAEIKLKFTFQNLISSQKSLLETVTDTSKMLSKRRNISKVINNHAKPLKGMCKHLQLVKPTQESIKRANKRRENLKGRNKDQQLITTATKARDTHRRKDRKLKPPRWRDLRLVEDSLKSTKSEQNSVCPSKQIEDYAREYSPQEMDQLLN